MCVSVFGFKNTQGRRTARGRQTRSLGWYRFWSRLLDEPKKKKKLESLSLLCAFVMQTGTPWHYHCKEIVIILSVGAKSTTASSVDTWRAECRAMKCTGKFAVCKKLVMQHAVWIGLVGTVCFHTNCRNCNGSCYISASPAQTLSW